MSSPTQKSLEHLRDCGYEPVVVEKWNPHAKIRQDLWGILDIIAIGKGETLGVQTTSLSNMSARVTKMADKAVLGELLGCGWRVLVHGWNGEELRTHEFGL